MSGISCSLCNIYDIISNCSDFRVVRYISDAFTTSGFHKSPSYSKFHSNTLQYIPVLLTTKVVNPKGHPFHPPLENHTGPMPESFGSLLEVWST